MLRDARRYALAHWLSSAALILALRTWQVLSSHQIGPLGVIDMYCRDALLLAGMLLLVYASPRRPFNILITLLTPLINLAHIMSYNYWRTHGNALDGSLIIYALKSFDENAKVFQSETPLWLILATSSYIFGAQFVIWALLKRVSPRPTPPVTPRRRAIQLLAASALCAAGVASPSISQQPAELSANPAVWLVRTWAPPERVTLPATEPQIAKMVQDRLETWDYKLAPQRAPKNVFVILLESTRASATTLYNPALDTTPVLMKLAERGLIVDQARAFIPHTAKATISILCGVRPSPGKDMDEAWWPHMPAKCLPQILRESGYRTALFQSSSQVFADWINFMYNAGIEDVWTLEKLKDLDKFEDVNYYGKDEDILLNPMRDWIRENKTKPLHMTLLTLTPHHDYNTPKKHSAQAYSEREEYNKYLNAVSYADGFIGRFVQLLKDEGVYEDSIIVLVGDHGEAFGEHGTSAHASTIYEEGLHVPLVVHMPWWDEARHISGPRVQEDILPTILKLLGGDAPTHHDGHDLLSPSAYDETEHICWSDDACGAVVRADGLKLLTHYQRRPPAIYDLGEDPAEARNLYVPEREADYEQAMQRVEETLQRTISMYSALKAQGGQVTGALPHETALRFGDIIELIGYKIEPDERALRPGDTLRITLRWRVLAAPGEGWTLTLRGPYKSYMNYKEGLVPWRGMLPSERWRSGQVFEDRHTFHIPINTRRELPLYIGWRHPEHGYVAGPPALESKEGAALLVRLKLLKD
jgi:lipoteichoic acid synthase